jgi:hypothetical protein
MTEVRNKVWVTVGKNNKQTYNPAQIRHAQIQCYALVVDAPQFCKLTLNEVVQMHQSISPLQLKRSLLSMSYRTAYSESESVQSAHFQALTLTNLQLR